MTHVEVVQIQTFKLMICNIENKGIVPQKYKYQNLVTQSRQAI